MLSISICVESRIYREGLSALLLADNAVGRVECHSCLVDLERAPPTGPVDVVVIDTTACGECSDCSEAIRVALRASCGAPVIALGLSEDATDALGLLEAGAAGCVTRNQSVTDLVDTVVAAAKGELRCGPLLARKMQERLAELAEMQSRVTSLTRLSQREHVILDLLDQRMSNKQIARQTGLELSTVKNHVHNILVKLDVSNRSEAAALMRVSEEFVASA